MVITFRPSYQTHGQRQSFKENAPATAQKGYSMFVNPNAALPEMVIGERIIPQVHPVDPIDGPGCLPQLLLIHFTNGLAGHGD